MSLEAENILELTAAIIDAGIEGLKELRLEEVIIEYGPKTLPLISTVAKLCGEKLANLPHYEVFFFNSFLKSLGGNEDLFALPCYGDFLSAPPRIAFVGDLPKVGNIFYFEEDILKIALISEDSVSVQLETFDLKRQIGLVDLTKCDASTKKLELKGTEINLQLLHGHLCACEAYGSAAAAFAMTVDYVKTREQFGRPIGSFQVIQHGLAQSYMHLEAMRALLDFAANSFALGSEQGSVALFAGTSFVLRHASAIIEQAVQYHGGIGFTWEFPLHYFLRRVKDLELRLLPTATMERHFLNEINR
jgi:hypothetical protein